jgi:hypothetical protein
MGITHEKILYLMWILRALDDFGIKADAPFKDSLVSLFHGV